VDKVVPEMAQHHRAFTILSRNLFTSVLRRKSSLGRIVRSPEIVIRSAVSRRPPDSQDNSRSHLQRAVTPGGPSPLLAGATKLVQASCVLRRRSIVCGARGSPAMFRFHWNLNLRELHNLAVMAECNQTVTSAGDL